MDDLRISGAPAQIALQGLRDLPARGLQRPVEQGLGGHEHPGRAVAALDCAGFDEGGLQRVQPLGSAEPLDGLHAPARDLPDGRQAGADGLSVEEHGAGPALAFAIAALFCAGEPQFVAQHIEQRPRRIDLEADRASVDGERYRCHLRVLHLKEIF